MCLGKQQQVKCAWCLPLTREAQVVCSSWSTASTDCWSQNRKLLLKLEDGRSFCFFLLSLYLSNKPILKRTSIKQWFKRYFHLATQRAERKCVDCPGDPGTMWCQVCFPHWHLSGGWGESEQGGFQTFDTQTAATTKSELAQTVIPTISYPPIQLRR